MYGQSSSGAVREILILELRVDDGQPRDPFAPDAPVYIAMFSVFGASCFNQMNLDFF